MKSNPNSRQESIFRIAAELFASKGYHATGVSELSQAVGLGRGALYHHISSKEELLFEINSRYLKELIAFGSGLVTTDLPADQRLRLLSRGVMRTIVDHLPELTVCFREVRSVTGERRQELLDLHERYERIWATVLRMGFDQGSFRTADGLAVKALVGLHHYSYLWIRPEGPLAPEDIADVFTDFTLYGISDKINTTDARHPQIPTASFHYPSRAPEHKVHEQIMRVASELFASKGYHATGVSELSQAVGLGRGALYHHISSKEELLFEINSRYLKELIAFGSGLVTTDLPADQRLRLLSRGVMRTIVDHLPELTVCFREVRSVTGERRQELLDLHERYERIWATVLRMGFDQGSFRTADGLAVKALVGLHHYSYLWIRPEGPLAPEDIADVFTDFALYGIQL
jgi:AcrR family transcriptional regulator